MPRPPKTPPNPPTHEAPPPAPPVDDDGKIRVDTQYVMQALEALLSEERQKNLMQSAYIAQLREQLGQQASLIDQLQKEHDKEETTSAPSSD